MLYRQHINIITVCIIILSLIATCTGIFTRNGPGPYEITSIRERQVMIYGKGAYKDMSAEVAPQGIAQDVVTLFVGIPLLITGLWLTNKKSLKGILLLSGTLGYFLVTYAFFTLMAMFNMLFLLWVILFSLSFFGFILTFLSLKQAGLEMSFDKKLPVKFIGGFLIFCSVTIALLWLSIVFPSLLTGEVPKEVEHYTTLVVQALDLAILLPISFISGLLLRKKKNVGYLLAPVYTVFLAILMTALTAKVVAMALLGYQVIPAIIIIPLFNFISLVSLWLIFKNINPQNFVVQNARGEEIN